MTFSELKNIRQNNDKDFSRSKLSRLCYVILFNMIKHEKLFCPCLWETVKLHDFCTSMCWRSNFSIEVGDAYGENESLK